MHKRRSFTVIQGKKKKKRPGEKLVFLLLMTAVSIIVARSVWSFARDALASALVKTVVSEEGLLEITVSSQGVLVRDERVAGSPLTGVLRWNVQCGERLAANTAVATITTPTGFSEDAVTPGSGMVVLSLDGLEGILQPSNLSEIDVELLRKKQAKPRHAADGSEVLQGSLLFKVVDNFFWYYIAELEREQFEAIKDRPSALLRFSFAPHEDVRGKINVLRQEDERVAVAFMFQEEVDGCFLERFVEADIIVRRNRGVVLPVSALLLRGEEVGVYTLDKSVVRYRQVEVIETGREQVVVRGLRPGLPVITNPAFVREGQRL